MSERCGEDETCVDGVCQGPEPDCRSGDDCPPPRDRCEGAVLVRYSDNGRCMSGVCSYSSVETRTDCGATGRVCSAVSRSCEDPGGDECTSSDDCPGGYCVRSVCVDCITNIDCDGAEVCVDGACIPCECPEGSVCDSSGECVSGDPGECTSDAECRELAEELGASPEGAACDPEIGCFVRGLCNGAADGVESPFPGEPGGRVDPFDAPCPPGTTCGWVFDLIGESLMTGACKGCTLGDDGTCRTGETCVAPVLPLLDDIPFCSGGGGGGLPFP